MSLETSSGSCSPRSSSATWSTRSSPPSDSDDLAGMGAGRGLLGLVCLSTPLLGAYMARVFGDGTAPGDRFFLPVERRSTGSGASTRGASSGGASTRCRSSPSAPSPCVGLYLLQRVQGSLPLNPTDVGSVPPTLAFNTAVSFVTNTNWQNYAGESTMTPPHADGRAHRPELRLGRRRARRRDRARARARPPPQRDDRELLGRSRRAATTRILLPLAFVFALVLVEPGRRSRTSTAPPTAHTVAGAAQAISRRARSRARRRSRSSGTNGGGPLNANSAHPFENPTGFTNLARDLGAPRDPVRAHLHVREDGGDQRQGWVVFAAMFVLWARRRASPCLRGRRQPELDDAAPTRRVATQPGGNMEGKEVRFGAGRLGTVRGDDHRHVDRRGQLPRTTASRRSAAPCRSSTSCSARSARAASAPASTGCSSSRSRRVHRRPDGRANAGVPRQEDPGGRDEARRALPARRAAR